MPTPPPSSAARIVPELLQRLHHDHPNATYELNWQTPEQLLVATVLAAQCTDERVNRVTSTLFVDYPDAAAFAAADLEALEERLKPTGAYRVKARSVQRLCQALVARFHGQVPRSIDAMCTLPGVQRKTANVVLNCALAIASGVIVDTHVARVSRRLGLTAHEQAERIESDLMRLIPRDEWIFFGPAMVLHGRYTCTARAPKCEGCTLRSLCPQIGLDKAESAESAGSGDDESSAEPAAPTSRAADAAETAANMPRKKAAEKAVEKAPAAEKPEKAAAPVSAPADAAKPAASAKPAAPANSAAAEPNLTSLPPAAAHLAELLPRSWRGVLADELVKPYFADLARFVAEERANQQVFPPERQTFTALQLTPFEEVRVVLLGQDPYHDDDQAHGLCFSVPRGEAPPPSLNNILKELASDVGTARPSHGNLESWAQQGVLLLNTVLTVRAHRANSHKGQGWETFTDAVIRKLSARPEPLVFVLWGKPAQAKEKLIDARRHTVLKGTHPSPLSAHTGFFGSKPFSAVNAALKKQGQTEIDWSLPE